ncbi:hypothetical protein P9K31_01065 [Corynebacterium glutamicum]|nr:MULTISPECIES: hypothetical protein [Corynebacterium]WBG76197.1 hypothetical protein O5J82_13970 [Corynebacterium glutamicum]WFP73129.1 hypothetical protein P9K31_01065 [Corynebacterium glutamicum]
MLAMKDGAEVVLTG